MAGIHVNKTAATWRSKDGVLNMILPDRCDDDMTKFSWRKNESDTTAYATTDGSQYDTNNAALATLDDTNWVTNNNVILWLNRASGGVVTFDRDDFFPLLYKTIVYNAESKTNEVLLRPIYFAMYPAVSYSENSDRLTLTFWGNVKEYDDTKKLEKFSYLPFESAEAAEYEIGNVISSTDDTITASTYQRALFVAEGKKISGWFNSNIIMNDTQSNIGDEYIYRETYLFETPIITFVPKDATAEVVIDVGGTGEWSTHRNLSESDGGIAFSSLYPATEAEATDSGLIHIIPAAQIVT